MSANISFWEFLNYQRADRKWGERKMENETRDVAVTWSALQTPLSNQGAQIQACFKIHWYCEGKFLEVIWCPNDTPAFFLKHPGTRDVYIRYSVSLNVWMTSPSLLDKGAKWRTVQFLAPLLCLTATSLWSSSQETVSRLNRAITHADEFTRQNQPECSTSHVSHVCFFFFLISNHKLPDPYCIFTLSFSLRG